MLHIVVHEDALGLVVPRVVLGGAVGSQHFLLGVHLFISGGDGNTGTYRDQLCTFTPTCVSRASYSLSTLHFPMCRRCYSTYTVLVSKKQTFSVAFLKVK